jgi:hypothetical protein
MLDKFLIEDTQRTPEYIDFKIPEYIDFEQTIPEDNHFEEKIPKDIDFKIPEDKSLRKMPDGTYK